MRLPFQGGEISKKCGKDDPEIAQNNFKSIFMTDKKIKHVDVTVDLPVKLIERLERRFEKKELIDKFVAGAVNKYLENGKKANDGIDRFIAEAIEEAL